MKQLDRADVVKVHAIADKAIRDALEKEGWVVQSCNGSYNSDIGMVNYKAKLVLKASAEKVQNMNAVDDWRVGDKAKGADAKVYTVTGFTNRGKVLIQREDGKRFKCRPSYLLAKA